MIEVIDLAEAPPEVAGVWADYVADHLRQSDRDELAAAHGLEPLEAMRNSLGLSTHAWAVLKDSRPAVIFGAAPGALPGTGIMWMLATDQLGELGRTFVRHSRFYFEELHRSYHLLWNYIDPRNATSMKWLRWCGFKIIERVEDMGPEKRPFLIFARSKYV